MKIRMKAVILVVNSASKAVQLSIVRLIIASHHSTVISHYGVYNNFLVIVLIQNMVIMIVFGMPSASDIGAYKIS